MPKGEEGTSVEGLSLHECAHLPPRNPEEELLISNWVNTHQAMFMATGIAAQCVFSLSDALRRDLESDEIQSWIQLCIDCRLASAVHTDLPYFTRERYVGYVRESMKKVHEGFSGVSNLASIMMEASLKELKQESKAYKSRHGSYPKDDPYESVSKADKVWWKHHGKAMVKLVVDPISLARIDFKKRQMGSGQFEEFEDYRSRVLRHSQALKDYDRYFAVERRDDLSVENYRTLLSEALELTADYVAQSGVIDEFRERCTPALFKALDLFEAKEDR